MTVYIKEDSMLKFQPCPNNPKDFPAYYEKKVHAFLQKFNMHHLLDNGTVTTDDTNCEVSAKLASTLMLSFKTKHIKWFMGSKSAEYKDCGIKMWQYLCAKVLDEDDEDKLYDKLHHPKMKSDESPLDYQLNIEQALQATKAKKLNINEHQVLRATGIGLDPNRYQTIMVVSYAIDGKTYDSLDQMVDVLDKFDKNPHIKTSCKASSKVMPNTVTKTKTPSATTPSPTVTTSNTTPKPTTKMLDNIRKITKK